MPLHLETAEVLPPLHDGPQAPYRILIVDDEHGIRNSLKVYLEQHGFEVDTAPDGIVALELFNAEPYDLVVTDIAMPEVSGLDLLDKVKAAKPDVEVVMITAYLDIAFAIQAMRRGAFDYFMKPFLFDRVLITIDRVREHQRLRRDGAELARMRQQREFTMRAVTETTLGFALAVERRDKHNIGHGRRTAAFARLLGTRIGLPEDHLLRLEQAAWVHDVGKIGIDDAILNKPDRLTEDEYVVVRGHPALGDEMLAPISFFADIRKAVRHHHERWDGQGYPDGLAGDQIPLDARILCIADYYDSITSQRPYRSPMSTADALGVMRNERGRTFDPALLDAFVACVSESLGSEE